MHRFLIAIVAACGGAAPRTEPTPAAPTSCPGQFIDIVSGGGHNRGSADHDTTCRDFPAPCSATPTCDCMKQVGYSLCSVDAKGQITIVELLPTAMPRSRE